MGFIFRCLAPTADDTLGPDDVMEVLEAILPAQNKSYNLGLKLKVPRHVLRAIHAKHQSSDVHLRDILEYFVDQIDPRPTWRVIIDALRSPAVNLPRLASRVEAAHFPDPTSTRDVVPETTPTGKTILIPLYLSLSLTTSASDQTASVLQRPPVNMPEREETANLPNPASSVVPGTTPTGKTLIH